MLCGMQLARLSLGCCGWKGMARYFRVKLLVWRDSLRSCRCNWHTMEVIADEELDGRQGTQVQTKMHPTHLGAVTYDRCRGPCTSIQLWRGQGLPLVACTDHHFCSIADFSSFRLHLFLCRFRSFFFIVLFVDATLWRTFSLMTFPPSWA